MSYTWAKVHIEILDDHKMGMLPDSLWRRVIELILLAKKRDKDGYLPGTIEMSWTLRISAEQLEADLEQLSKIGIVQINDGEWYLTNFVKRQAADPVTERVRNFRKRHGNEDVTSDVTQSYQTKTRLDTDKDTDKDIGAKDAPAPTIKKAAPKQTRERDLLFDAIAKVCCVDPSVKGNGASVGKVRAALLATEPPYTPAEILAFGEWWHSDDWRRKKGPPTLWKLREQIGIVRNGNGQHTEQPMTPAQKAILISRQRDEERKRNGNQS